MAHINFRTHVEQDGTDHKDLFINQLIAKAPEFEVNFREIIQNGLDIETMEFYSYALFEEFNANNDFFNSFSAFNENAEIRKRELDRVFVFDSTIGFRVSGNSNTQIMYAGCGVSLNVASKIFNLTNADFIKIPEQPGRPRKDALAGANRTLDFEYWGSNGTRMFRVECKGKEGLGGSISTKISHIISKKVAQPAGTRDFCFGVVGLLPVKPDSAHAIAYFVDPEIPDFDSDPLTFRLAARLRYYADRMSNLGNSKWIQQIKGLFYNSNFREYEYQFVNKEVENVDIPLREFIGLQNYRPLTTGYYFKCTVIDIPEQRVFGRLAFVKGNEYFFYGFLEDLFATIEYKTIGDFLNYKSQPVEIKWSDTMRVWDGYLEKYDLFLVGNLTINVTGEVSGTLFSEEGERT